MKRLEKLKRDAMDTSMQELVIQDDHFDAVKSKANL